MSTCTKWFYAEDAEGKSLPFAARFEFYELKDNKFVDSGIYGILSGSSHTLSLDSRKRYKIVPLDKVVQNGKLITLSGWIIPNTVEFTGCLEDITLVYKKIICTPSSTKCVGNAVHKCNSDGTEWKFLKDCSGGCKDGECLEVPVMAPVISSIGTKETPKICEPVKFESKFDYNDEGWQKTDIGTGLRRAWWEYSTDDKEWTSECADELDWVQFSDASWPTYTFIEEHVDIRHIRHTIENKYGERACAIIDNFRFEDANGFVITVDPSLNGKPLIVWHVVKVPHAGIVVPDPDLYFAAFAWVRGTWNSASSDKVYKVPVGDIQITANPAFDEMSIGTLFDGQLRDGFDCVILARESPSSMKFGYFKKEDVFKLHSDKPTCVGLKTASNDVLTEAIMGPVCDLFKIPRGDECESFWVEFYDPVFIANYASILKTGKDTLGNTRELTAFDHLALPFAVIGVIAPQFPFGKFVSKGSEVLWTGGKQISDAAFNWMKTVVLKAPGEIIEKDVLTFMESIVRLSGDHIDEVLELMVAGKFDAAKLKINEYLPIDFGSIPFRRYAEFNDALREHLTQEQFEQLMSLIHGFGPQVDSVIKTAGKTDLTTSDIGDLALAAKVTKVMDDAADVIYTELKTVDDITDASTRIKTLDSLKNIFKNSPELSAKIVNKHLSILDDILYKSGDITNKEINAIFIHGLADPKTIMADVVNHLSISEYFNDAGVSTGTYLTELISRLDDGTYRQTLADAFVAINDFIVHVGQGQSLSLVEDYCLIGRTALKSAYPAATSALPNAVHNFAENAGDVAKRIGRTLADELTEVPSAFTLDTATDWRKEGTAHVTKKLDDYWEGVKLLPAGDSGPLLLKPWEQVPSALPETVGVIDKYREILEDIDSLNRFADMTSKAGRATTLAAEMGAMDDAWEAAFGLSMICKTTPEVVQAMTPSQLEDLRKGLMEGDFTEDEVAELIANALKPISKFVDKYSTILKNYSSGIVPYVESKTIREILSHGILYPKDITDLLDKLVTDDVHRKVINRLTDGGNNQPLGNMLDSVYKYKSVLGDDKIDDWIKVQSRIYLKAFDSADPAKMADIPHAAQNIAAKQDDIIEDYCGGHSASCIDDTNDLIFGSGRTVADEIVDATSEFVDEPTSNWSVKGKDYVKSRYDKTWNWFNGLSDKNKENAIHGMMAAAMLFVTAALVKIYTDSGPATLNHKLFTSKMDEWYWPCYHACDDERVEDLEEAIKEYEEVINSCEQSLNDYKAALETYGTYEMFERTLKLHEFNLGKFKTCLEQLQPSGIIRCTSNQPGFHVFIDDESKGHAYTSKLMVIKNVKAGSHKVKIEKGSGYTPTYCEETVTVTEGGIVAVDCQMTKIEECSEVTNVKIYIDPLSPLEGDTVAINGSADSYDPIEESGWKWDFGDKSTKDTGQAVTHVYSKAEAYTVRLTVTNDCGISATSTRVITVKEKEEPVVKESCTLLVKEPIDSITGKKCTRSYDAEIYVDGNTIGKKTQFSIPFGTNDKIGGYGGQCGESHVIKIVLDGYDDTEKSFTIKADDSKEWQPEMTKTVAAKETGFIDCKTTPTDAEIFIDGVYYGNTDKKIEISSGDSWVVFKAEGYEDCDAPVTVVKGETVTAECVMVATKLYEVDITVPVGATLFVDGKEIEMTQVSRLSTILRDIRR